MIRQLCLLLVCLPLGLFAQIVNVGNGSYTTAYPPGEVGPTDHGGNPITSYFDANFVGPKPTNDWWTSLAFDATTTNPHSFPMFAKPLAVKAEYNGLGIGYPNTPSLFNTHTTEPGMGYWYGADLTVGMNGLNASDAKAKDFGDWTVTAVWDGNGRHFEATFGHGLPFVYCKGSGGNAKVSASASPTIWYQSGRILGITVNGHHYGIFAPTGATWSQTGNDFYSNLAGQDYFSVALLPDNNFITLSDFSQYAYAFVTNTEASWVYNATTAETDVTFNFTITPQEGSESETLTALFRHQWLHTHETFTNYTYEGAKGEMKVVRGNSFQVHMPNNGMLPAFPKVPGIDSARVYSMIDSTYQNYVFTGTGFYWGGKDLNKAAQLVYIADQVNHTVARDHWLNEMKAMMQNFFTASPGETGNLLVYDSNIGSLLGFPASFGSNTEMNDHHFHYGYWIMAAATVAEFDQQWANDWGGMVNMLIRDCANWNRNDPMFPFLRNFDIYAGHSWAGGWANSWSGNNQESTSEAVHCAAGIAKWGMETGNDTLTNLGMMMYTTETQAALQYWFDVDEEVYPAGFPVGYTAIHWGTGGVYQTFFSGLAEHIHGINYLPATAYSLYFGADPDAVWRNYQDMVSMGGVEETWRYMVWQYLAYANSDTAKAKFDAYWPTLDYSEVGESPVHALHSIYTLNELGQLNTQITANIPHYAVFTKDTLDSYVAYNPNRGGSRMVTFSDGTIMAIAPGELKVLTNPEPINCGKDIFEPNDSMMAAAAIPLVGSQGNARICLADDIDWFTFTTTTAKPNIHVRLWNLPENYELELYDAGGNILDQSYNVGLLEDEIFYNIPTGGTYYVKVFGRDNAFSAFESYNIQVRTQAAQFITLTPPSCGADRFEPNDSQADAVQIPARGLMKTAKLCPTGDEDWYYINVPANRNNLRVYMSSLPASYVLEVYDSNGSLIGQSNQPALEEEEVILNALPTGVYYIRVHGMGAAWSEEGYSLGAYLQVTPW